METKTSYLSFILLLWFLLISACAQNPVYYPDSHFIPVEAKSTIRVQVNGIERGGAFEVQQAITEKTFVSARYSISRVGDCDACFTNKRSYSELAIGMLGKTEPLNPGLSGVLIGAGFGTTKALETTDLFSGSPPIAAQGNTSRAYLQYFKTFAHGKWETPVSFRVSGVKVFDYREFDPINSATVSTSGRDWGVFIEPATGLRYRFGSFALDSQVGLSLSVTSQRRFHYDWLIFSVGGGYSFSL